MLRSICPELTHSSEWVRHTFDFRFSIGREQHETAVQWSIERSDQYSATPRNVKLFPLHAYHRTNVSINRRRKTKPLQMSRKYVYGIVKFYLASCWNRFRCFPYRLPCITWQKHTRTQAAFFRLVCVFAIVIGNCYTKYGNGFNVHDS